MSFEATALLISWVAILLLGLVVSGLVRQVHALQAGRVRVHASEIGLRQGAPAPEFDRLAPARPGTSTLLLFLSEGCAACEEAMDEVTALAAAERLRHVAVRALFPTGVPAAGRTPAADGSAHRANRANGNRASGARSAVAVLAGEARLFERYQVPATPFAVVVDSAGRVTRSEPVGSRHNLQELVRRIATTGADPSRPAHDSLQQEVAQ
jgi:hypothetical protein